MNYYHHNFVKCNKKLVLREDLIISVLYGFFENLKIGLKGPLVTASSFVYLIQSVATQTSVMVDMTISALRCSSR